MKLFCKNRDAEQEHNVRQFERLMAMNTDIKFFQPQPLKAPWHVQAEVNGYVLNFWPHRLKGNFDGEKAVQGYRALQALIGEAREDKDDELLEDNDGQAT